MNTSISAPPKPFKVLSLDGGGGKGVYTLGVLREIERAVKKPLKEEFDFFYGTSTGSIIAGALATGATVDQILAFYLEKLPSIMKRFFSSRRSAALQENLEGFFGKKTFSDLEVGLAVVATSLESKRAIIFKNSVDQAHGMKATFLPGFGLTLAEAIEASCSAYPFFCPKELDLKNAGKIQAVDGGFVANNPSLYALVDVRQALKLADENVRILSIGTGIYPESYPVYSWLHGVRIFPAMKMISTQFTASANSTEKVFELLSKGIPSVRINQSFAEPRLSTSLFEHRPIVLNKLLNKGRESYASAEDSVKALLNIQ
ncbi:MAG: patatin-like phospholipase family protein [Bacteriovoracia bacterium]